MAHGPGPGDMGVGSRVGGAMWQASESADPVSQTPDPQVSTTPPATQRGLGKFPQQSQA